MRKAIPQIVTGGALCLLGCAFFFLWRKLSYVQSSASSESIEPALRDLESFKRTAENELSTLFDRCKSIMGKIAREKRGSKADGGEPGADVEASATPPGEPPAFTSPEIVRKLMVSG